MSTTKVTQQDLEEFFSGIEENVLNKEEAPDNVATTAQGTDERTILESYFSTSVGRFVTKVREWNAYANQGLDQYDHKYCLKAEFGDNMQLNLSLFVRKGAELDLINLIECTARDDFNAAVEKAVHVVDALWDLARAMKGDY